jgi:hypothetical protein
MHFYLNLNNNIQGFWIPITSWVLGFIHKLKRSCPILQFNFSQLRHDCADIQIQYIVCFLLKPLQEGLKKKKLMNFPWAPFTEHVAGHLQVDRSVVLNRCISPLKLGSLCFTVKGFIYLFFTVKTHASILSCKAHPNASSLLYTLLRQSPEKRWE